MSAKLFGILFAGFASIFIGIGLMQALAQELRIRSGVAVPVTIESSELISSRNSKDTRYAPAVRFSYVVHDRPFTADTPLPMRLSGSRSWAQSIVDRFPAGTERTGYYDRNDPGRAYLLIERSFIPFLLMAFAAPHFCVGMAMIFADPPRKHAVLSARGFELQPRRDASSTSRVLGIMLACFMLTNTVPLLVYFLLDGKIGLLSGLTTLVSLAALGGLAWVFVRSSATVDDKPVPTIFVDEYPLPRGKSVSVELQADPHTRSVEYALVHGIVGRGFPPEKVSWTDASLDGAESKFVLPVPLLVEGKRPGPRGPLRVDGWHVCLRVKPAQGPSYLCAYTAEIVPDPAYVQ